MDLLSPYFNTSRAYLVGVSIYDNFRKLDTPLKDINDIATCLLKHDFHEENITIIEDATQDNIEKLIEKMIDEIQFRDRVLFYFAGHGVAHDSGEQPKGFIIPKDGNRSDEKSLVEMDYLAKKFSRMRCKHFLLILDCCFAGSFRWSDNYRDSGLDQTKKLYRQKFERFVDDESSAWQVITSSSYDEEAIDSILNLGARDGLDIGQRNSPFASIIISALEDRKEDNAFQDGIITATRLYNYIDYNFAEYLKQNGIKKRQVPNFFPLLRSTKGQFIFLVPKIASRAIEDLPTLQKENPYKGLASFQTKDSHLFFGRKNAVKQLVDVFQTVAKEEMLMVVGSSGIGKSSLVMAGLIPALSQIYPGTLDLKPLRPGDIKSPNDYLETKRSQLLAIACPFILYVDQFEEMVTICSEIERLAWEAFLFEFTNRENCRVVISMRSDFEPQLKESRIFRQSIKNRFIVPPFERQEIKDIITQPALQAIIKIEANNKDDIEASQFIDRICNEAMQSLGSLPLLSFALQQWYEANLKTTGNVFLLEEKYFNGIGGVHGALSTIIDEFMRGIIDAKEEGYVKQLMLRMVTVNDDNFSRTKAYDYELDNNIPVEAGIRTQRQLLEELIRLRIVTTNRKSVIKENSAEEIYYEPAHDAVLTSWKKLWEWINENKIELPVYQQLATDSRNWFAGPGKSGLLWSDGANFSIVREKYERKTQRTGSEKLWDKVISTVTFGALPKIVEKSNIFNTAERAFIRRSLIQSRRRRAQLNLLYTAIVLAAIISIVFAIKANTQEEQARSEARKNLANLLANQSDNQEVVSAFYSLQQADSLYPDNPPILQRIFRLFTNGNTDVEWMPTNILPLKNELKDLEFTGTDKLRIVDESLNTFDINLLSGKWQRGARSVFPEYDKIPSGFFPKEEYFPEGAIIPFSRQCCTNETSYFVAPYKKVNAKFLFITPSGIRLNKFLGTDLWIRRDTCISAEIPFTGEIDYVSFMNDSSVILMVCHDNSIYLADFTDNKLVQLIKGYRMGNTSKFYALSDDESRFAAVNSNKLLCVWDFRRKKPAIVEGKYEGHQLFENKKLSEAKHSGDATFEDANGKPINIWLMNTKDDYVQMMAHNSAYDEFVVCHKLPNKYYVIGNKSTEYKIELPNLPDPGTIVTTYYSSDGDWIYYNMYRDSIYNDFGLHGLDKSGPADSILAYYPSLHKIKYWIRGQPALVSDSIP